MKNTPESSSSHLDSHLFDPVDRLATVRDPVDEGGGGGAGLVLLRLPHELPHRDHPRHLDASQQVCLHLFLVCQQFTAL